MRIMTRSKKNFYAVRRGRQGPQIYRSWPDCHVNTSGFPNAEFKGFPTLLLAENYLHESPVSLTPSLSGPVHSTITPNRGADVVPEESYDSGISLRDTQSHEQLGETHHNSHVSNRSSGSSSPISDYFTANSHQSTEDPHQRPNVNHEHTAEATSLHTRSSCTYGRARPDASKPVELSAEQHRILDLVEKGDHVFFTGSAGTGKSVLLRAIISTLRGKYGKKAVAVTAATGIAGLNIEGATLHSFAGIGLGKEPADALADKILSMKNTTKRWTKTRTLLIDEISMVDGGLLDKLDYIGRKVREASFQSGTDKPFGGIQLVLSGDFCQLPPVPDQIQGRQVPAVFAFESRVWKQCIHKPLVLTKVFRQKNEAFIGMLSEMRYGRLNPATVKQFRALEREVTYDDGIEPTELYPRRYEVKEANEARLAQLTTKLYEFKAQDRPGNGKTLDSVKRHLERLIAPEILSLKEGAQVMLIKNQVGGHLVNGSVGKIVKFSSTADAQREMVEIPLPEDDPSKAQAKLEGKPDVDSCISRDMVWPVVRFTCGCQQLILPEDFDAIDATGHLEASRRTIPLILAWAMSIHKSQGQTLERVKVDVGRAFEDGQVYVALSRATKMESLQILNFQPSKVTANPRVLEWHSRFFDDPFMEEDEIVEKEIKEYEEMDDIIAAWDDSEMHYTQFGNMSEIEMDEYYHR